jgi:hypothetical protein
MIEETTTTTGRLDSPPRSGFREELILVLRLMQTPNRLRVPTLDAMEMVGVVLLMGGQEQHIISIIKVVWL